MFDTVIEFFNNWKDACIYASECGVNGMPGSEFFGDSEFYLTLGTIMGVCWTIWFVNERKIAAQHQGSGDMQALSDQQKIYGIAGALVMLAGTLVGFSAGVLFAMFDVSPSALVTILIMGAIGFFVGITVATPQ